MINIPKGTKDVLPEDSYKWRFVEDTAREIARLYFLKEIRTPVFEHTELFNRGVGDTSANSIGISYDAIVTPVSEAVTNTAIASVLFIIAWDAV
mgnify:CR=1 FL=1